MGYCLGVDLGSTCVAAAVARESGSQIVRLGSRAEPMPAEVYLREDGTLLTGEAAAELRVSGSPDRGRQGLLRLLGDDAPVVLGGRSYSVPALLGTLLHDVLQTVVEVEGGAPDRVALAYPVRLGPSPRALSPRALFQQMARFAGLVEPMLVAKPDAIAARFAGSAIGDGELTAVYDLGGGSLDVTVLRKFDGRVELLGVPGGVARLGGMDFDAALANRVREVGGEAFDDLDRQADVALARLTRDCALAKEELSDVEESKITVELPGGAYDVFISRDDFEYVIRPSIESSIGALHRALNAAGAGPGMLGTVLLQGGCSRIPLVSRMVFETIGCPIASDVDPRGAVALGAALLAAQASGLDMPSLFSSRYRQPAMSPAMSAARVSPASVPTAPPEPVVAQPRAGTALSGPAEVRPGQRAARAEQVAERQAPSTGSDLGGAGRGRWPSRLVLLDAAVVAVIVLACAITLLVNVGGAKLTLTNTRVPIGTRYFADASGFQPGEPVRFSWTGPTQGVMMPSVADQEGRAAQGPIIERDPPGSYLIVATGLRSGRMARTQLQVLPAGS